ncbi:MAG TPA: RHS repeat-associated core domain-containing protein [Anaeromyxobacteraceae bacterium]|nr:RHS repeat-associated core domain-containing protein [Anaeromyxobacteraceae bacterium]
MIGPRQISRRADGLVSGTSVSGVSSTQSYNNHGELRTLAYSWPGGGSFQQVLDRDSLGRIVKVSETGISAHTYDYHYDAAGRLDSVAVDGSKTAGYTYDANGNRVAYRGASSADTASATYDAQDRMLRYGGTRYTYTANGELARKVGISADTTRYTYDALGNLTGVHLPSGDTLVYVIDGENRRVARRLNGSRSNTWLYQSGLQVVAEVDSATGTLVNRYVYGTQRQVPDLLVRSDTTYRLITDQLGSVRAVVEVSGGTVVQRIDYDPWGVRTTDAAPTLQTLGYVGGLSDGAADLVRFGARDYQAAVGRWTSKDSRLYTSTRSECLYSYAYNEPVDFVDPDGTEPHFYPPSTWPVLPPDPVDCALRYAEVALVARQAELRGLAAARAAPAWSQNAVRHRVAAHEIACREGTIAAISAGILWEAHTPLNDPHDTVVDLVNDVLGALGCPASGEAPQAPGSETGERR